MKVRPYRRRTRRRDILWLRKIHRRVKIREWVAMEELKKYKTRKELTENTTVKVAQCLGVKTLVRALGGEICSPRHGQKVKLCKLSAQTKHLGSEAVVVYGKLHFIKADKYLAFSDLPLHCHLRIVSDFSEKIQPPQTARQKRRSAYQQAQKNLREKRFGYRY